LNTAIVSNLYDNLLKQSTGARVVNIDLHIHTPASKDFVIPQDNQLNPYLVLLDEAIENTIEIIAITDHNTFTGFNELKTILSKLEWDEQKKYRNILILCGIEITAYSNHLLAIFNDDFTSEKQALFLHEIGIEPEMQGSEHAMADELGPSALLRKIADFGGISLLAHADSSKGFLHPLVKNSNNEIQSIAFQGKSLAKIVKSEFLFGIQISSEYGKQRVQEILRNKDYCRMDRFLPLFYFSDAHGLKIDGNYTGKSGKAIGEKYSSVKLSYKSFSSLKMALSDPNIRVYDNIVQNEYPTILGCAIKSDIIKSHSSEYTLFHFNSEMNCIIGARGTGKSTLLGMIAYMFDLHGYKSGELETYSSRYSSLIVYIKSGKEIYALSDDVGESKIYRKSIRAKKFSIYNESTEFLSLFLTKVYMQSELYEYSRDSNRILNIFDDYVMWKHYDEYGFEVGKLNNSRDIIENLFKLYLRGSRKFNSFISDSSEHDEFIAAYEQNNEARDNIAKLRKGFVDKVNLILDGKLRVTLKKGLESSELEYMTKVMPERIVRKCGGYYEYQVKVRNFIERIIAISQLRERLDFFALLSTNDEKVVLSQYQITPDKQILKIVRDIKKCLQPLEVMISLKDRIALEYNVNLGVRNATPLFRPNHQLSLGQNAVALLLIILSASQELNDFRPLIMDQPEDDLDNSYIYNTLVEEFRNSKMKRQIIISTHNANIPVAADAENIFVLKYNGICGYLDSNGSIDNPKISRAVLEILEGGEKAIQDRLNKYKNF
jgi:ABC-type cobalamin/Fe3+-siderophores transport system ATPase subunit